MARVRKDWLKTYIDYTAQSEAPREFHFWTGVSTIAGALQRKVWIYQKYFNWVPNFYIVLVAPAGVVSKSTSIGMGQKLLREVEGAHFGPSSLTWQALAKSLSDAHQAFTPDTEMNIDSVLHHQSAISCFVSELGTFLDPLDRKFMDVITDLWDSPEGEWTHATSSQGSTTITNPWINFIAGTTPAWLKANFPDQLIGAGLTSRIIFVFGDKKRHLTAYPGLLETQQATQAMFTDLVRDLQEISGLVGEYKLTPEAIAIGENHYEQHWTNKPAHLSGERFGGYMARKQTHIHKLALILQASRNSSPWIEADILQYAIKIISATENYMVKVFESIGVTPTATLLIELLHFLHSCHETGIEVSEQLIARWRFSKMSEREYQEIMDTAVKARYIKMYTGGKGELYFKAMISVEDAMSQAQETEE